MSSAYEDGRSREYCDRIAQLIESGGGCHSRSILSAHREDLYAYFLDELRQDDFTLSREFLEQELPHVLRERIPLAGQTRANRVVLVPAGPVSLRMAGLIEREGGQVVAYLDNDPRGCLEKRRPGEAGTIADGSNALGGVPLARPEQINQFTFDHVFISTPDAGAQSQLDLQLKQILPAERHDCISSLGELRFLAQLHDVAAKMDARIASIVHEFNLLCRTSRREPIVIAVSFLMSQYIPLFRELRRQGHPLMLITQLPWLGYGGTISDASKHFDRVHCCHGNHLELLELVSRLEGAFLWTGDYYRCDKLLSLFALELWRGKAFHEIYGLFFTLDALLESREWGKLEDTYCRSTIPLLDAEEQARPLLYQRVDGLFYRDSGDLLDRLRMIYGTDVPAMQIFPFGDLTHTLSRQTQKTNTEENESSPHIAFCGHITQRDQHTIDPNSSEACLPELALQLAENGIHCHFYNPSDPERTLTPMVELDARHPLVHYHPPVSSDELHDLLGEYDWGWLFYKMDPEDPQLRLWRYALGSRLLSHVAAGLPTLCSSEYSFMASTVKRHDIGLVIARDELDALPQMIHEADVERYRHNTRKLRETWNVQAQYGRVVSFLRSPRIASAKHEPSRVDPERVRAAYHAP